MPGILEKNPQYGASAANFYPYSQAVTVMPGVRVVLAPNPKDYTGPGTNTYIWGDDASAWIIDPGPDDTAHQDAVLRAVEGRKVLGIVITHSHLDHSPGALPLSWGTSAPIYGHDPVSEALRGKTDEDVDWAYAPDVILADGDILGKGDLALSAHHTPGHFPNHMCYQRHSDGLIFSGDHVLEWATTVVVPPLGKLANYLHSLGKLQALGAPTMLPSHGGIVGNPRERIDSIIRHRQSRHKQILSCLECGVTTPIDIVHTIYQDLTPRLVQAAEGQVRAHLDFENHKVSMGLEDLLMDNRVKF